MLKPLHHAALLSLALSGVLSMVACSQESTPTRYDFVTVTSGGPKGWPVWVEDVTFDESWGVPAGGIESGIEERPPRGGFAHVPAQPAPQKVEARWFSYRTQTFYEIEMELPEDMDDKLSEWYQKYPTSDYRHHLITGFSGKGEALVWWRARCNDCGTDRTQDFNQPIIENAQAEEVEGDPSGYRAQTQNRIDEGTIPSPWNDERD